MGDQVRLREAGFIYLATHCQCGCRLPRNVNQSHREPLTQRSPFLMQLAYSFSRLICSDLPSSKIIECIQVLCERGLTLILHPILGFYFSQILGIHPIYPLMFSGSQTPLQIISLLEADIFRYFPNILGGEFKSGSSPEYPLTAWHHGRHMVADTRPSMAKTHQAHKESEELTLTQWTTVEYTKTCCSLQENCDLGKDYISSTAVTSNIKPTLLRNVFKIIMLMS